MHIKNELHSVSLKYSMCVWEGLPIDRMEKGFHRSFGSFTLMEKDPLKGCFCDLESESCNFLLNGGILL